MATWQRWAAAERLAVRDTNWAAVVRNDGCALEHVLIRPVTRSEAAGIPRGVVADAVVVTAKCSQARKAAHRPDVSAISSYCTGMTACTTKSITDGVAAVGTVTYDGNPSFMGAEYTCTKSSGSSTGHVELGNDTLGSGCGVGSKVANAGNVKLTHDRIVGSARLLRDVERHLVAAQLKRELHPLRYRLRRLLTITGLDSQRPGRAPRASRPGRRSGRRTGRLSA